MTLSETRWHDLNAWALESDHLRVIIVPQQGAKIASIFDKRIDREWLIQPSLYRVRSVPYGAPYHEYDMNSWDEMFPTIVACPYPVEGAYKGRTLPDHGEVWAMPWSVESCVDGVLGLSVEGRALSYRFTRKASLADPATLQLDYQVTNTSRETMYYLWAPHPLYAVDEQTEIMLPPEIGQLYNVHDVPPWGAHGKRYDFPHPETDNGKSWDLRRIGPASLRSCRKFYVPPEQPVSWAGLRQSDSGAWLRMDWDETVQPYLGIWIDEGTYATVPTVALEPTNAFYDGLALAYQNQKVTSLDAGKSHQWHITVCLDAGQNSIIP